MGLKINRDELIILDEIDAGGEGRVYNLPEDYSIRGLQGPFVYKEYFDFIKRDRKSIAIQTALDYMVNTYEHMSEGDRLYIDQRAAWPLATVVDHNGASGLIMRKVIARMVDPEAPDPDSKLFSLDRWIQTKDRIIQLSVKQGFKPMTPLGKKRYLQRLFTYFAHIHTKGWVIGDISDLNILAYVPDPDRQEAHCSPVFIDTDAYRWQYGGSAIPQKHTGSYIPPEKKVLDTQIKRLKKNHGSRNEIRELEVRASLQTQASDVYKAALIAIRLYDESNSPTQAFLQSTDLNPLRKAFNYSTIQLIIYAFDKNPSNRPTMKELAKGFYSI